MTSLQKYQGLCELFWVAAEYSAVVGRWSRTAVLERAADRYRERAVRAELLTDQLLRERGDK